MRSIILGPPGVILLGVVIAGLGAFWQSVKQKNNNEAQGKVLLDISARSGNKRNLEELIRKRSQALEPNRQVAERTAEAIIKRLPTLTAEFYAREQNELELTQQLSAEFRLAWEPLIKWTFARFESLVEQCKNKGIDLDISAAGAEPALVLEGNANARGAKGHVNEHTIREVKLGQAQLSLTYSSAEWFLPGSQHRPAIIKVYLTPSNPSEAEVLLIGLGLDQGNCRTGPTDADIKRIDPPKDGIPPKEFTDFIDTGLANALERLLILGSVEGKPQDQSSAQKED